MFRKRKLNAGIARYCSNTCEKLKSFTDSSGSQVQVVVNRPSDSDDFELPSPETFSLSACLSSGQNLSPVQSDVLMPDIDTVVSSLEQSLNNDESTDNE